MIEAHDSAVASQPAGEFDGNPRAETDLENPITWLDPEQGDRPLRALVVGTCSRHDPACETAPESRRATEL
jgi:hypothetical protein